MLCNKNKLTIYHMYRETVHKARVTWTSKRKSSWYQEFYS